MLSHDFVFLSFMLFMFLKLANVFASRKFWFIKVKSEFKPFVFTILIFPIFKLAFINFALSSFLKGSTRYIWIKWFHK